MGWIVGPSDRSPLQVRKCSLQARKSVTVLRKMAPSPVWHVCAPDFGPSRLFPSSMLARQLKRLHPCAVSRVRGVACCWCSCCLVFMLLVVGEVGVDACLEVAVGQLLSRQI